MNCIAKIILFAVVCMLPMLLHAQESGVIRGIVLESGTSKRLGSATVTNKNSGQITASNSVGTFEIRATVGDSLTVYLMGYQTVGTEVTTLSDILIDMKAGNIMLEQVDVTRMSKEAELQDAMRSYRKQGVYYDGKPSALAYVFTPITALYERFGRTPQNARRFQNYMHRELEATEVDRKFNKTLINELTGLEGDDLNNFVIWYRPTFEKVQYWGEYDITAYIVQSFKQFDRDGRPTAPRLPKLETPSQ